MDPLNRDVFEAVAIVAYALRHRLGPKGELPCLAVSFVAALISFILCF